MRLSGLSVCIALGLIAATGCNKHRLIPNTKVPDTVLNREVLQVVEKYRRALERRDAARVLVLVDPAYHDNGGTPEPDDDIDYPKIKEVLVDRLKQTRRIRYRMEYQGVEFKGRKAYVDVWIDSTFVISHPDDTPHYRRFADAHRFTLVKTGKSWRFLSGL